jgi:hypothetical protein
VVEYSVFDSVCGEYLMPRLRPAPHSNLRVAGLIREAEMFASALQMIALGMTVLEIEQGDGVTANAVEISKRLAKLKKLCCQ